MSALKQSRYQWRTRSRKFRIVRPRLGQGGHENSLSGWYSPRVTGFVHGPAGWVKA